MNRLLLILLVAFASGCASYQKPIALPEALISTKKLAEAALVTSTLEASSKAFSKVALANGGECIKKGPRLPFTLFVNPQIKDMELRAAFMQAGGWTEQPKFVSLHESTLHLHGKYVVSIDGDSVGPGEVDKAWWAAYRKAADKKTYILTFSDSTSATLGANKGCDGLVAVDGFLKDEPRNQGIGFEVLPMGWVQTATNPDELLFLMGRSLYFTSDKGQDKLSNAMLAGAAVNGVLRAVTFGVSALFVDTKVTVPTMVRTRYLREADAFGFHAAVRTGADPVKVLAYVQRMAELNNAPWPELRFGDGRLDALTRVATAAIDALARQTAAR